jgi:hypothetical protein
MAADHPEYVQWLEGGGIPTPADPPEPLDPTWLADQAVLATLAAQYATLKAGIVTINGHMDQINAGPASPTAAQTGGALKLIASDVKTILVGFGMLLDDMKIFVQRVS